jgi:hypothetical protein
LGKDQRHLLLLGNLYSNPSKTPPVNAGMSFSFSIILLRSIQASAPKSILWLSLKALLAIEKLVNIKGNILGVDIELTPSVSFEFGQENNNTIDAWYLLILTLKLARWYSKPRLRRL